MEICVYGAASEKIDSKFLEEGFKLGEEIAKRNHTLIFGGGDTGMMGAVVKGVIKNKGKSIGIAPEWMKNFEGLFPLCDEFIHTKTMDERKNLFLEKSDAFIISPGGTGTLDEFFEIFTLKKLKRHNKAIIIFNIHNYYDNMINMINEMVAEEFLPKDNLKLFEIMDNVEDILEYIENYDKK